MKLRKIETLEELKEIQLEILNYVATFCDKKKIVYWLNFGTLLGAVRHKGFIPWDDDIDLGMTRENYDKFIKSFEDKNGRYSFHCVENDQSYCYQMGKVFDNNTILYEPDKKNGYKISVYIDIFVHDPVPEDAKSLSKLYDKRDLYAHIRTLQKARKHNGILLRRLCVHGIGKILSLIPSRLLAVNIAQLGREYRYLNTRCYGNLIGDSRLNVRRELMDHVIKMEFEGNLYNVPVGYKEILTQLYGDYMKLPPVEKRVRLHSFEAYCIEHD